MRVFGLVALLLVAAGAAGAEMTTSPRPQPRPVAAAAQVAPVYPALPRPKPRPAVQVALPQAVPVASLALPPASLRPLARPAALAAPVAAAVAPAPAQLASGPRPKPRPAGLAPAVPALAVAVTTATEQVPRPKPRPAVLLASATAPVVEEKPRGNALTRLFGGSKPKPASPTDGFVCGDPDIKGDELAPITSKVHGCGVAEPVRVTSVDGVRLRGTATIDCTTAKALKRWIDAGMRPAFAKKVVELQIAGSYVCRPRNNIRGNKISEHGSGKAVDISAFVFADGSSWTVKDDYNRQIRKAHKAACGIFGTTLGPGSDGYHEDHLHFDTAGYRNGPYCR